ncbi:MAG TPA: preprotein translocase subunit SecG [bacterium]|jgi:preprotein translocase subunit SecG|nr:MAG: preprotein translocase subunit SecG [Parcubacteria group bacterium ADurb.Bin115]HNU81634.1 preprotein translocase subunit SecG [bacterium]HOD87201.1 preprotein translocase subunit SecG [bacterium]HPW05580.1 preprotein translocase subunit SecG [bacterium]HPY99195.1 preprotein translocase subunit SecG [bacterium]
MSLIQIAQIIVSILLIIVVLLQNRGAGLGSAFGGTGGVYLTKRGLEKKLFIATIVLAVLFFGLSLVSVLL